MSHPEVQKAWNLAFIAAQAEMPDIPKKKKATIQTRSGGNFSYSYADLPDIIDRVRPVLAKHSLAFTQSIEGTTGGVLVTTRIYHSAGHVETFGPIVLPSGEDARAAGSAITYARRYALCAALGIAADEDDDAEAATRKTEPPKPRERKAAPKDKDTKKDSGQSEKPESDSAGGESQPPPDGEPVEAPDDSSPAGPDNYLDEIARLQKVLDLKGGALLRRARETIGEHIKDTNWSKLTEDEAQVFIVALKGEAGELEKGEDASSS